MDGRVHGTYARDQIGFGITSKQAFLNTYYYHLFVSVNFLTSSIIFYILDDQSL